MPEIFSPVMATTEAELQAMDASLREARKASAWRAAQEGREDSALFDPITLEMRQQFLLGMQRIWRDLDATQKRAGNSDITIHLLTVNMVRLRSTAEAIGASPAPSILDVQAQVRAWLRRLQRLDRIALTQPRDVYERAREENRRRLQDQLNRRREGGRLLEQYEA